MMMMLVDEMGWDGSTRTGINKEEKEWMHACNR